MKIYQFAILVADMRAIQKLFHDTKDKKYLLDCRAAEHRVDQALKFYIAQNTERSV